MTDYKATRLQENERMNQRSMNQWTNESTNQRINESMNPFEYGLKNDWEQ